MERVLEDGISGDSPNRRNSSRIKIGIPYRQSLHGSKATGTLWQDKNTTPTRGQRLCGKKTWRPNSLSICNPWLVLVVYTIHRAYNLCLGPNGPHRIYDLYLGSNGPHRIYNPDLSSLIASNAIYNLQQNILHELAIDNS